MIRGQASLQQRNAVCPQKQVGYQAASRAFDSAFDLAFDLKRPVRPRWPESDIGSAVQTGMDAGLAALGQGWPFAAARRINVGLRACRAPARDRVVGQERFAYFCAVQK